MVVEVYSAVRYVHTAKKWVSDHRVALGTTTNSKRAGSIRPEAIEQNLVQRVMPTTDLQGRTYIHGYGGIGTHPMPAAGLVAWQA